MIVFFLIDLFDAAASCIKDHIISGKTVLLITASRPALHSGVRLLALR